MGEFVGRVCELGFIRDKLHFWDCFVRLGCEDLGIFSSSGAALAFGSVSRLLVGIMITAGLGDCVRGREVPPVAPHFDLYRISTC